MGVTPTLKMQTDIAGLVVLSDGLEIVRVDADSIAAEIGIYDFPHQFADIDNDPRTEEMFRELEDLLGEDDPKQRWSMRP